MFCKIIVSIRFNVDRNNVCYTRGKTEIGSAWLDPTFGARPLRRVIQENVEDVIAEEESQIEMVKIGLKGDRIVVNKIQY